jgi:glycosyltransferase involved in cell wall biosynthesis
MTAFNQEAMIAEAIEGVLKQKTSFPVELHIGDDCSTDTTGEICRQYAAKYPDTVRYHRRDPNLGMMPNFLATLGECDGKYVAWCEGDDYWIDESKLQTQFDFMEANEDFSLSTHNHFQRLGDRLVESYDYIKEDFKALSTEDYMLDPHFQTASYFFRRSALPERFPDWYHDVLAGDHFLVLFLSLKGKIAFFNKRMSVFRTYDSSVTGTKGPLRIKENFVRHLRMFDRETDHRFRDTVDEVIRKWELVYKVYEPTGYVSKLAFFVRNFGFYASNFQKLGGTKLAAKYLISVSLFNRMKRFASGN